MIRFKEVWIHSFLLIFYSTLEKPTGTGQESYCNVIYRYLNKFEIPSIKVSYAIIKSTLLFLCTIF